MDKFRAMQTFIAVAESGNFAEAARNLNISAPSVTRLVNELEAELGVLLLNRTTRHVVLTDIGKNYLRDIQDLLSDMQYAEESARGANETPTGSLRVTSSNMFGQIYIAPIITEYLNTHNKMSIEAVFLDRVVNMIDEGIDVAVRIGELNDSSLMATRVGSVQVQICGSPSYIKEHSIPQTPSDLTSHQTIGLKLGSIQDQWKFADNATIKLNHRLSFNSIPAAIQAAQSGWGLVRVLSYQIGPQLKEGSLQTVLQDFAQPPIPIHVVHGHGRQASAKIRTFVDAAAKTLRANPFLN
ncbi:LysR family transcriptional regulator [Hirschia maritima]|uniref:LysR family transcriptional regulator n=1 Tax=Hirschia maritima TaxID=1121961 RepID=UPI00036B0A7E|nr:LysR family transcriptional regulator [Hirschia maritima]